MAILLRPVTFILNCSGPVTDNLGFAVVVAPLPDAALRYAAMWCMLPLIVCPFITRLLSGQAHRLPLCGPHIFPCPHRGCFGLASLKWCTPPVLATAGGCSSYTLHFTVHCIQCDPARVHTQWRLYYGHVYIMWAQPHLVVAVSEALMPPPFYSLTLAITLDEYHTAY